MQPQNDQNSGMTIKRGGEGKNWEVMVSQEFWNNSNSRKDVQLVDSQQKATSSVHFPPIRNRDESNLVNNTEKAKHREAIRLCGINQVSLQVGCQLSLGQLSSTAQDSTLAKYSEAMVALHSKAVEFAQEWEIRELNTN